MQSVLLSLQTKNVKMGRDDAGSMMSELLMRMARDHEEKHSRKELVSCSKKVVDY